MDLNIAANFSKNGGEPATGLTLSDINLYLSSVVGGVETVLWNGSQHPTLEVTALGSYLATYGNYTANGTVIIGAHYVGADDLDSDWISGAMDTVDSAAVGAIKLRTDMLVFTVPNQLDVNVIDWKNAAAPAMTGDAYAIVNHADYGNAKLVRSQYPANTLQVDTGHQALSNVNAFIGSALNGVGAYIAAAFTQFFSQPNPQGNVNSLPLAAAGAPQGLPVLDSGGALEADAGSLTAQQVRDAMKLAPTAGAPDAGSIDKHLNDIPTNPYTGTPPSAADVADAVLDEAKGAHAGLLAGVALDSTVAKDATVAKDSTVAKDATVAKAAIVALDATVAKEANVEGHVGNALTTYGTAKTSDVGGMGTDLTDALNALDTLLDQIKAQTDLIQGPAADKVIASITIDDGLNPLDGADVWLTTDEAGLQVVANGVTDAMGHPDPPIYVDPGTYWLWSQLAGYNFTGPTQIVVA